jgi:hypothetical protein
MSDNLTEVEIEEIVSRSRYKKARFFIFFDKETGKITAIDKDPNYRKIDKIPAEFSDIKHIIDTTKSTDDYKVVFDDKMKKYQLKEIENIQQSKSNFVYKIPNENKETLDIKISQDNVLGFWVVTLSENIFESIKNDLLAMEFYITAENDANILIDTLRVIDQDFDENRQAAYRRDSSFETVSVYCRKFFNSYLHEVRER